MSPSARFSIFCNGKPMNRLRMKNYSVAGRNRHSIGNSARHEFGCASIQWARSCRGVPYSPPGHYADGLADAQNGWCGCDPRRGNDKPSLVRSGETSYKPTSGPRHQFGWPNLGLPVIPEPTIGPSWPSAMCSRNLAKHTTSFSYLRKWGARPRYLVAYPSGSCPASMRPTTSSECKSITATYPSDEQAT